MKKILIFLLFVACQMQGQTLLNWYPSNPMWTSSNPSVYTLAYQSGCYGYVSTSDCINSSAWNAYNNSQITSYTSPTYSFICTSNVNVSINLDINLGDRIGSATTGTHYDWLYFQYSTNGGTTWINPVALNTRANGSGVSLAAFGLGTNNRNGWSGAVGAMNVVYSIPASLTTRFRFIFESDGSVNTYNGGTNIYYADILGFTVTCPTPLPIELISFDGVKLSCGENMLIWSTATELNNSRFEIEKSLDGITFTKIGSIAGASNSTSIKRYQFIDNQITPSINYYRLKQIDFDGSYQFSNLISIDNSCESQVKTLKILNLLGQEVDESYNGVIFIYRSDNTIIKRFQHAS